MALIKNSKSPLLRNVINNCKKQANRAIEANAIKKTATGPMNCTK